MNRVDARAQVDTVAPIFAMGVFAIVVLLGYDAGGWFGAIVAGLIGSVVSAIVFKSIWHHEQRQLKNE